MNRNRNELSYKEVLERIFHEERVPIYLLHRLTDLTEEEAQAFDQKWAAAPAEIRAIIARHLADISEDNFVVDYTPIFRKLLEDTKAEVRLAALDGLWDCSDMSLVSPLILHMQQDVDERVRAQAAATLGHIVLMAEWGQVDISHGETIVEALINEFQRLDNPPAVRRASLESMSASGDARVPDLIHGAYYNGDEAMQVSAVFAMGRNADERWLPVVLEELESYQSEMRLEAAQAAGTIGSSDAVESLIYLLNDEDLEVRLAAIFALGKIGNDFAREALQDLLNDPFADEITQEAAEQALEEMSWLGSEIDLSLFALDYDEDDDWLDTDDAISG